MSDYRRGSHTVYQTLYHFVWATKYRYHVLTGEVAGRCRDLIRQSCLSRDIRIVRGHVSKDHIHILASCPPKLSPAKIMQDLRTEPSHVHVERDRNEAKFWLDPVRLERGGGFPRHEL